jgi:hypothetical protein
MRNIRTRGAQAFFLIVFPMFFAYHTLAAYEVLTVPLVLGGWWSWANVAAAVVLGPILLLAAARERLHYFLLPVLVLVGCAASVALWHFLFGEVWQRRPLLFIETLKLCASWVALYAVGNFIVVGRSLSNVLLACLAMMAAITPFLVQTDPFSPLETDRWRFQGQVSNYAGFANSVACVGLILMGAFHSSARLQTVAVVFSLFCLLLLGARFELGAFLIVVMLWLLVAGFNTRVLSVSGLLVLALAGLVSVAVAVAIGATSIQRYAEILDIQNSGSIRERLLMFSHGLADIKANPITGNYAGQTEMRGEFGDYIHNALSAWRQFGLLPFVIYCSCIVTAFVLPLKRVASGSANPKVHMALYAGFYSLILAVAAKSVFWSIPALAWGLCASVLTDREDTRGH